MSISVHELNYTPSRWSKRYDHEELTQRFNKFCGEITAEVRKSTKNELNIPYGNSERTMYDVYGTDLPKDAPILIFIHGGYWQEFSKDFTGFTVPAFVANGVKVVTVGYDLCPQVRIGDIVSQIKTAIEHILKSASDSGCRCIWIVGHSAGSHLAASILHDKTWLDRMIQKGYFQLLKGVMLIAGIYKLRPLLNTSFNEPLKLSEEEITGYSFSLLDGEPIQELQVVVAVGECESLTFINESREYAQKLITFVDKVQYILLRENTDHFDIVEKLVDPKFILTKVILDNMFPK